MTHRTTALGLGLVALLLVAGTTPAQISAPVLKDGDEKGKVVPAPFDPDKDKTKVVPATWKVPGVEKPDTTKVYALQLGKDAVLYLPPGMKYRVIPSDFKKDKADPQLRKDGGLTISGRTAKFVRNGEDVVTFKLVGTFKKAVEVGLPLGYDGVHVKLK